MIIFEEAGFSLLELDETVKKLRRSRHRLSRWQVIDLLRSGELVGVRHGGRWMVAPEEVADFVKRWSPPERVSGIGVSRRFIPPPPPADLEPGWD